MATYEARRTPRGDVFIVVQEHSRSGYSASKIETRPETNHRADVAYAYCDSREKSSRNSRAVMTAQETTSIINAICSLIVIGALMYIISF